MLEIIRLTIALLFAVPLICGICAIASHLHSNSAICMISIRSVVDTLLGYEKSHLAGTGVEQNISRLSKTLQHFGFSDDGKLLQPTQVESEQKMSLQHQYDTVDEDVLFLDELVFHSEASLPLPPLRFRADGSFTIVQFADLHFGEAPDTDWGPEQACHRGCTPSFPRIPIRRRALLARFRSSRPAQLARRCSPLSATPFRSPLPTPLPAFGVPSPCRQSA